MASAAVEGAVQSQLTSMTSQGLLPFGIPPLKLGVGGFGGFSFQTLHQQEVTHVTCHAIKVRFTVSVTPPLFANNIATVHWFGSNCKVLIILFQYCFNANILVQILALKNPYWSVRTVT